mmetsp:Transcript_270/g.533  ORF Transcript_270/g.533 Transcript_270/m.533 type:complete len:222 (-) Transcript_270:3-668(-)
MHVGQILLVRWGKLTKLCKELLEGPIVLASAFSNLAVKPGPKAGPNASYQHLALIFPDKSADIPLQRRRPLLRRPLRAFRRFRGLHYGVDWGGELGPILLKTLDPPVAALNACNPLVVLSNAGLGGPNGKSTTEPDPSPPLVLIHVKLIRHRLVLNFRRALYFVSPVLLQVWQSGHRDSPSFHVLYVLRENFPKPLGVLAGPHLPVQGHQPLSMGTKHDGN